MVWPQQRNMWGKFISVSILSKRPGAWTWTCVLCDLNLFILKLFELRPVLSSILYNFLLLLAYFVCLWIERCGVILLMSGVRWQVLLCCIAEWWLSNFMFEDLSEAEVTSKLWCAAWSAAMYEIHLGADCKLILSELCSRLLRWVCFLDLNMRFQKLLLVLPFSS